MVTPREQQLLERLADEGKPTKLTTEEIALARDLASIELVFIARDAGDAEPIYAVITPKGRKALCSARRASKEEAPSRVSGLISTQAP